jgi:cell cycle sensor histidine kinase DivJ
MLFFTSVIASYLYDTGFVSSYNLEPYGLFGAIVFMSILAYLIVKFKAFNIKLIGAQALVWFLVIVVGAQFLYVVGITSIILTSLTLIVSSVLGLILVRSVKKEISQREHIEKLAGELQVANKGQENLIHIMNHQIKGFLGITRNIFAELLQGEDYGVMPDPAKPLLEKGLETTVKGVDYVQAILRGASAEKGTLTYDMKPINVRDIVSELISKQKSIVEKAGLAFESKIGDGLYGIVGDAIHIKEAFKNLITNAIKYNDYTYPDRSVRVDLEREGSNIVFSVRDTGIGIKDEDKPRMFTAGGAGKDSLKYNVESSGFGLSYVKGVADRHGGKVGFKSNAPEKGTTFFIKIPVDAK